MESSQLPDGIPPLVHVHGTDEFFAMHMLTKYTKKYSRRSKSLIAIAFTDVVDELVYESRGQLNKVVPSLFIHPMDDTDSLGSALNGLKRRNDLMMQRRQEFGHFVIFWSFEMTEEKINLILENLRDLKNAYVFIYTHTTSENPRIKIIETIQKYRPVISINSHDYRNVQLTDESPVSLASDAQIKADQTIKKIK